MISDKSLLTLFDSCSIITVYMGYMEVKMAETAKKTKYYLDIDPELRNRMKAFAALKGKTMRDWLIEAIIAKLEDEIDASEGLASLADAEGTKSLEDYLA